MPPTNNLHFAIVGGGITGLTLAIALHHRGLSVKLYEQAPSFREIGAGVAFTPNAVQAMQICQSGVYQAFETVRTRNMWASKQKVWFDYYDGINATGDDAKSQAPAFTISNELGNSGVHRAKFLDELVKLVPDGIAHFGKRLDIIDKLDDDLVSLTFTDGSTATANAILGCDGIKSRVRQIMFGEDHPCVHPTYTYKYAYRALVPMDTAVAALGEEKAQNSCMHMGPSGHMLTFPINHGQIMNVVAFTTTDKEWPDSQRLTLPAKREDALRDFERFGDNVKNVLKLADPDLDIWAIFDTGKHPMPAFNKGRICLVGDAAHASSPHHGAGAGMGIEDCAVLSELLADETISNNHDVEAALAVFDSVRRQRGQWLVQSSRHIGDCYEWLAKGVGDDFKKIESEINHRNGIIANVNVREMCEDARKQLKQRMSSASTSGSSSSL